MSNTTALMSRLIRAQILETFVFYDRPLLYSCKDKDGTLYLALLTDETDDFDTFLYVLMSEERFNELRAGKHGIQDAFAQAESSVLELTSYNRYPYRTTVRSLTTDELDFESLPEKDVSLL